VTAAVALTNPDRVLFPEDGITKRELVDYYRRVARWLLPYVADRPLTLQRWPIGIHGPSFFEKQVPRGAPSWIATSTQPSTGKRSETTYPLANDERSLLYFANLATITLHVWASRTGSPGRPDFYLFDLDPFEECTIATLGRVALTLKNVLAETKLAARVKTTGGKGLHVIAPIPAKATYEQARSFNEGVARTMKLAMPDEITLERKKADRPHGTVYFDWAQLGRGKTLVPPFAVRARIGAPVSMPLAWDEVEALAERRTRRPTPEVFRAWNMTNVPAILAEHGDPWEGRWTR
jgi:bifunctional non-homologous end joining protein LigD